MSEHDTHELNRTVRGGIRKRALEACSFCRRRKIRCDAAQPICTNCRTHNRQCRYDKRVGDDRLSHGLHRSAGSQSLVDDNIENTRDSESILPAVAFEPEKAKATNDRSISRVLVADDGRSSYHGQTSAFYELQEGRMPKHGKRISKAWMKKALLAEAAIQRQMEIINFNDKALDFDGVDPELGMHLLSLHWNRQHHSFLITYRPAFMRDMACGGRSFSKLLLNAIYFGSSKFSPRLEVRKDARDVKTAGWKYRQRVKELLGECLDRSEITTIQALLVMANSLFALGNERSAAWLYSGLAFRMIIDLGMHSESSTLRGSHDLLDEDIEIRRRVFWGAFVVDKIQSLYHGRLPSLQTDDASVPIEFLDLYEENEQWEPFAYNLKSNPKHYGQAYSVSTFTGMCKLSVVMNSILNELYAERIMQSSASQLTQILETLHQSLEKWRDELPEHLRFEPSTNNQSIAPPHVLSLSLMYNVLLVLLHRPFVSDGHLFHNARSLSVSSLLTCIGAATMITNILRIYHQAFSIQRAPYLISYATYVAATIHVRIAAQRPLGSNAHRHLLVCLEVFRLNEGTNAAAKRAETIVEGLMRKLNVSVAGMVADLDRSEEFEQPIETTASRLDEPEAAQFSPNFNIEAVIQSFTKNEQQRNNEASQQLSGADFHNTHSDTASSAMPEVDTQSWQALNPGYYQYPQSTNNGNEWLQEWQFSAYPTDDVLFGFNGSATDGFFSQQPF